VIIPVAIIRWRAAKVLLIIAVIVTLSVVAIPAALCSMRAFFEPAPTSAAPVAEVKVRRYAPNDRVRSAGTVANK
jgi:hypothetical protein